MPLEDEDIRQGMPSSLLLYLSLGSVACFSFIFFIFLRILEKQEQQEQNNEDFKKVIIIDDEDEIRLVSNGKREEATSDEQLMDASTSPKWSTDILLISNAAVPFFDNENELSCMSKDSTLDKKSSNVKRESKTDSKKTKESCFRWPQDSSLVENIKQGKGGQVDLGEHLHSKINKIGILRKATEIQRDDEDDAIPKIEEAARKCAHMNTEPILKRRRNRQVKREIEEFGDFVRKMKDWRERNMNIKQRLKLQEGMNEYSSKSSSNEDDYEPNNNLTKTGVQREKNIKFIRDLNLNLVRVC